MVPRVFLAAADVIGERNLSRNQLREFGTHAPLGRRVVLEGRCIYHDLRAWRNPDGNAAGTAEHVPGRLAV